MYLQAWFCNLLCEYNCIHVLTMARKTDNLPYMDLSQIRTKQLKMKKHFPHICVLLTLEVIALSVVDLQRL